MDKNLKQRNLAILLILLGISILLYLVAFIRTGGS